MTFGLASRRLSQTVSLEAKSEGVSAELQQLGGRGMVVIRSFYRLTYEAFLQSVQIDAVDRQNETGSDGILRMFRPSQDAVVDCERIGLGQQHGTIGDVT